MIKTWVSYIVLAIGLMLLVASDRTSIAEDKHKAVHNYSFGSDKNIQVFVNKMGKDDATVDLIVNGEKIQFSLPELLEGESKTITTDDGKELKIIAAKNNHVVWVDGDEINLPKLHMNGEAGHEGLSSIISRVHTLSDFEKNTITVSGEGIPDDAVKAIVEAAQGVLTSYGIDKEVIFRKSPKMEFITIDDMHKSGMTLDTLKDGKFEVHIETDTDTDVHGNVMVIEKKIKKEKKEDN